jgi:predicted metalloprotease
MRWQTSRRSDNVEDQRGTVIPRGPMIGGGAAIIILIVGLLLGADPAKLLETVGGGSADSPGLSTETSPGGPADEQGKDFVAAVLGETEDVWQEMFIQSGRTYERPHLVLFTGAARSACGFADAATGPFYCPGDRKVYLDMSFFRELERGFGASGDFARAYVIAHEIGHHVQNQLGIMARVDRLREQMGEREYKQLSVRLELQADFLAGVWANHAQKSRQILEAGDVEEALNAASAIGDDRIQKQMQGYVVPDAFTHGTSAQRVRWFRRGLESGDMRQGDTFSAEQL